MRFVHLVDPAIRRKCSVEDTAVKSDADLRVVSIESLGVEMPMYDITTGTGDFIANGVISHNCFARRTHEWLELDSGHDFDSQIVVKTNLVDVLRRELARPSWKREHVALGTNTDPYQRAEGRYQLMPGVIRALTESGTPFSILTKGTLLRRDIPLLAEAAQRVPVGLGVSMAIWDDELHESLEPGVPTPRARLDLVRAITDAGLPCGVFLAPVLPGLTDGVADLDAALGAIAAAGATGVTVIPLHLRPGAREWFMAWLARAHPELVPRYEQLYARRAYVPAEYRTWLAAAGGAAPGGARARRQRGGAARKIEPRTAGGVPGDEEVGFPAGSLPTGGSPSARGARPSDRSHRRPGAAGPALTRRPQPGAVLLGNPGRYPYGALEEVPIMGSPARTTGTFTREQLVQRARSAAGRRPVVAVPRRGPPAGARPVATRRSPPPAPPTAAGRARGTGWRRRRATPAPSSSARRAPCSSASTGSPSAARAGSRLLAGITLVLAAVGIAVALAGPRRPGGPPPAGARGAPAAGQHRADHRGGDGGGRRRQPGHRPPPSCSGAGTAVLVMAGAQWLAPSAVSEAGALVAVVLLAGCGPRGGDRLGPGLPGHGHRRRAGLGGAGLDARCSPSPPSGWRWASSLALWAGAVGAFYGTQPEEGIGIAVLVLLAAGGLAGYVRSGRWPLAAAAALALAVLVFRLTSDSLGAPVALLLTGLILLGAGALLLVRRRAAEQQP